MKEKEKKIRRNRPSLPRNADNTQMLPSRVQSRNQSTPEASRGSRICPRRDTIPQGGTITCVRDYIAKWSDFGSKERASKPASKKGSARAHDKCKKVDRCAKLMGLDREDEWVALCHDRLGIIENATSNEPSVSCRFVRFPRSFPDEREEGQERTRDSWSFERHLQKVK